MPLNDVACRQAKPKEKPHKLSDEKGLYLEIAPSGGKWWRLKYRMAQKEKRLSLGVYPEVSLKEARARRDEARELLAKGIDPSEARKEAKQAVAAAVQRQILLAQGSPLPGSLEYVAREWLNTVHRAKVSEGHAERTKLRLEQNVFPWLGAKPAADIEPPELLECLRRIVARGAIETAHRTKDACSQVFRYAIASGYCVRNPAADLKEALPTALKRNLAAATTPAAAAELLRAIQAYKGDIITRCALDLSALLFLRPGELRQLEWTWIDADSAALAIPASLMKRRKDGKLNGAAHVVPLSHQSLEVLNKLRPLTSHGKYIFPSRLTGARPMSENTVRGALRRLGYSNDDMTAHGFRAMARTLAAESLGIAAEVIEAQLAHEVPDALGRAYNRAQWLDARRNLMQRWADYLDTLKAGGNIVAGSFGQRAA